MKIEIEFPDTLPEGHGGSFKKGIADELLSEVSTPLFHTPNGHGQSRESGGKVGQLLVKEIAKIVKKPNRQSYG
jgi:hypothetical protein